MKNLFLAGLLCLHSLYSFSQQSIGIGTASPHSSAQLDITSTSKGLLIPRMTTAQRTAIATPANGLLVYDNTTTSYWFYKSNTWTELGVAGAASQWITSSNNIYSGNSGNVGIGTSSPSEKLSISNGKIFIRDNRADQDPNVIFDIPAVDFKRGGLQWHRAGDTLAALHYVANPSYPNYIQIGLQQKGFSQDFVVNGDGHTGLGIVNPAVKFHIRDRLGVEVMRMEAESPLVQFRRRTNAPNSIPDTYKDIGFIQTSADNLRIGTNSDNNTGKLVFRVNGGDRMFIDASGNVSIGTEAVAAGYKVSVAGKIVCEEVRVQIQSAWPDYVFGKDYKLMPLQSLQNFIATNQHLPNIPAARQIEKEGLNTGDMQRRMMEKIEELTLYILDLQKQIDQLKK